MFKYLCKQHFPIILFQQPIFTSNTYNHGVTCNHASADGKLPFSSSEGASLSSKVFSWKKLLRTMKQMILCYLSKEFAFSRLLTGEKSKSK